MLAYKSENGDVDVPIKWHSGLGTWASVQRRSENNGKLPPDRKARLDEIGFEWDKLDLQWKDRLNELLAYKAKHGDMHVPQKWPSGLGAWVSSQKANESDGKLTAERRAMLDEIGFSWDNRKPKTDWDERFNELLTYKTEHGNLDVPRSWQTGLGTWIGNQKSFLRDGKLSSERKNKLLSIGLAINPLESRWESKFNELLEYRAEHGDINVPNKWPTGLRSWMQNQKTAHKQGKLSLERKTKLDEIGFVWANK